MQLLPYILVIISAITHVIWNFLAKQGDNKDVFIGLSKLSETVLFLGPFLIFLFSIGLGDRAWYIFVNWANGLLFAWFSRSTVTVNNNVAASLVG